ncbi:MAG: hydrogenase maturation nickel metallochaperone HypA [Alphaproteobacteria bacterium]
MHELGITRNIVAIVSERAGDRRVRRVTLDIGRLSAIMPDAIAFCFDVCSQGTVLDGAELRINRIDGRGRCRSCGEEFDFPTLVTPCPACGARGPECIAGEDMLIREMELEVA